MTKFTNEEIQSIVARAEDEYELLKDKCHDYFNENKKLKERIDKAIEYIKQRDKWYKNEEYKLLKTSDLLDILEGKDE